MLQRATASSSSWMRTRRPRGPRWPAQVRRPGTDQGARAGPQVVDPVVVVHASEPRPSVDLAQAVDGEHPAHRPASRRLRGKLSPLSRSRGGRRVVSVGEVVHSGTGSTRVPALTPFEAVCALHLRRAASEELGELTIIVKSTSRTASEMPRRADEAKVLSPDSRSSPNASRTKSGDRVSVLTGVQARLGMSMMNWVAANQRLERRPRA